MCIQGQNLEKSSGMLSVIPHLIKYAKLKEALQER